MADRKTEKTKEGYCNQNRSRPDIWAQKSKYSYRPRFASAYHLQLIRRQPALALTPTFNLVSLPWLKMFDNSPECFFLFLVLIAIAVFGVNSLMIRGTTCFLCQKCAQQMFHPNCGSDDEISSHDADISSTRISGSSKWRSIF